MTDFEKKLQEHLKIALEDFNKIQKENDKLYYELKNANKEIKKLKDDCEQLELQKDYYIGELRDEIKDKDREILQLKKFDNLNKTFFGLLKTAFKEESKVDELFETLKAMLEKQEQDKIEFTIKQLEKVNNLYKKHLDYEKIYNYFRVQLLEEDIERLIADIRKIV